MLETAVSPWHGFLQNMAYVMMNHLLKAGPTNVQVTYGYSVHLVSDAFTCLIRRISPVDYQHSTSRPHHRFYLLFYYF